MNPKKVVLFIDDEPQPSRYYREALQERGYAVEYCRTAESGVSYLEKRAAEVDVIVLDMMMPTPKGVPTAETEDGQLTGVWLLKKCRDVIEAGRFPVLVLTNSKRVALEALIIEQVTPLDWRLLVRTKNTEVTAQGLPDIIDEMLR